MRTMTKTTLLALLLSAQSAWAQDHHAHAPDIPMSMRDEHEEIQWALADAMKQPGEVGAAAKALQAVLHPHFVREEQIALPPLGLIRRLAEMQDVQGLEGWLLPRTDSLRAELPRMLKEHETIGIEREKLEHAARAAGNEAAVQLAQELGRHALSEEEMFYPMALLVGEIVRFRAK